ncbi:GNAT family N-acetyltransferase [Nocardioides caricicola]|uniref:GNAT family N-acetyltransferase n=1 Tax=Nocardioides caricicola TaxID=634770 RepID=A0ABW0MXV0_9ACTN
MDIRQVTWDDADAVRRTTAVSEAVRMFEEPWSHPKLPEATALSMRHGWDGEPSDHFLVTVDGADVAVASYETATYDNLHVAWFGVDVHPEHRRRGHGSAVVEVLLDRARSDGKTSVGIDSWDLPGPEAFAARHGFERKQVSVNRRQVLAKVDRSELDRLHAAALAAAADYELVRRVGATPEDELPVVARLTEAINDAPLDDLDIEDEAYPPERIVAYEAAQAGQGHVLHRVYARHRETGELAGHTVVAVEGLRPWIAHQHDTSVVRAHRGHRLGVLLKTEMVRWLAEVQPQVETIDTWNAESNDHMIGVNEALGYEVLSRAFSYQRSL